MNKDIEAAVKSGEHGSPSPRRLEDYDVLANRLVVLQEENEKLQRREQVLFDIHNALGIKWGDDPYSVIAKLREDKERLQKELDGLKA